MVLETFDSAAIYASDRDWTMRGTIMSDNLIYSVGNKSTVCNSHTACSRHAIYLGESAAWRRRVSLALARLAPS